MATFTVTTADDVVSGTDGKLSLREAVAQANATAAADTIVFAGVLEGGTLSLTGGELALTRDTVIDGDRDNDGLAITLSGSDGGIIGATGAQTDLVLRDCALVGGGASVGGAVDFRGHDLIIDNSRFEGNHAFFEYSDMSYGDAGGAVYFTGNRLRISDSVFRSNTSGGGGAINATGSITIQDSVISGNSAYIYSEDDGPGGGLYLNGTAVISGTLIAGNYSDARGGAIVFSGSSENGEQLTIADSTIVGNGAHYVFGVSGGGVFANGTVVVRSSVIAGNSATAYVGDSDIEAYGGGIFASQVDIANSIVVGNTLAATTAVGPDIFGDIVLSNGHNIFGSDVTGNVAGDLENITAGALFASLDPGADGVLPLVADLTNPALSGADRLLSMSTDQLGSPRPVPSESNPDTGAAETGFVPSHVASTGNDVLTGTTAANAISGLGGHDFIKGLAGNDTLSGNNGGDFLTGGLGNDKLNGGNGIDLVNYADLATAVTVDLRGDAATDTDTARRGSETDTLTGIEGAVGSSANDTFFGDSLGNWFQGGGGKDTYTGGAGRDLYDYNLTSATGLGTGRDVITDFDHLVDDIDLAGIDADATVAGNQAFRWVGSAALTGAGEVGYFNADGNTIIRMSTDADTASEGEIQLSGIRTLTAVDFYL